MTIFRRIANRLAETRDVRKFAKLLAEVEAQPSLEAAIADMEATISGGRTRNDALEELVTFLVSRNGIAQVLQRYEVPETSNKERLKALYWALLRGGAGQRIGGIYVATAGLYNPELLMFLLQKEADGTNTGELGIAAMKFIQIRGKKPN